MDEHISLSKYSSILSSVDWGPAVSLAGKWTSSLYYRQVDNSLYYRQVDSSLNYRQVDSSLYYRQVDKQSPFFRQFDEESFAYFQSVYLQSLWMKNPCKQSLHVASGSDLFFLQSNRASSLSLHYQVEYLSILQTSKLVF